MLGSRFDLDKTVAAIAAKRELDQKSKNPAQPYSEFDAKLKAFVDILTRDSSASGIFTTPLTDRERTRF